MWSNTNVSVRPSLFWREGQVDDCRQETLIGTVLSTGQWRWAPQKQLTIVQLLLTIIEAIVIIFATLFLLPKLVSWFDTPRCICWQYVPQEVVDVYFPQTLVCVEYLQRRSCKYMYISPDTSLGWVFTESDQTKVFTENIHWKYLWQRCLSRTHPRFEQP